MGTKITKGNVKSAIKDDKAHMDYLKRDVRDDQRAGGEYKDINQTADEKHISKLAGDVRHDQSFLSKHWSGSSPAHYAEMHDGGAPGLKVDGLDGGSVALKTTGGDDDVEFEMFRKPKVYKGDQLPSYAKAKKEEIDGPTPGKFVEIAGGEVDGVAYGAADVDGHIAIDTSTVGYDDTANLP